MDDYDPNDPQSMSQTFQQITDVVCSKLDKIIKKNEQRKAVNKAKGLDPESDYEDMEHQFMDFTTDEFINKNIRVRP